jgi:hypothetical protein
MSIQKKDVIYSIRNDSQWRVRLIGVNEKENTVDDIVVDRIDGQFFKMIVTKALGYLFPMFFETLDKQKKAGNICLLVRQDEWGCDYVVVEEKICVDIDGKKIKCFRASRSSVSSPESMSIESQKGKVYHLHPIELNNERIAGPVETWVVVQDKNEPLEVNQKLYSFARFAETDDGPGQAVLAQFLMARCR